MAEGVKFVVKEKQFINHMKIFCWLIFLIVGILLLPIRWEQSQKLKTIIPILNLMVSSCALFYLIKNFSMTTAILNIDREPALKITRILTDPQNYYFNRLPLTLELLSKSKVVVKDILIQLLVTQWHPIMPDFNPRLLYENAIEIPKILPDEKEKIIFGNFNLLEAFEKVPGAKLYIITRLLYKNPLTQKDEQEFVYRTLEKMGSEFKEYSYNKLEDKIKGCSDVKDFLGQPLSMVREQSQVSRVFSGWLN